MSSHTAGGLYLEPFRRHFIQDWVMICLVALAIGILSPVAAIAFGAMLWMSNKQFDWAVGGWIWGGILVLLYTTAAWHYYLVLPHGVLALLLLPYAACAVLGTYVSICFFHILSKD